MSGVLNLIWGVREAKYFCSWDWTGFRVRGLTLPVGQSHCGQAVHGLATASLPWSNATKQSTLFFPGERWIASQGLSSDGAFAPTRRLAMTWKSSGKSCDALRCEQAARRCNIVMARSQRLAMMCVL
jgi:hypothetical protein